MTFSLALQYVVIALVVAVSAWVVASKQFPNGLRRLRMALALPLVREQRAAWLQRVGYVIAPAPRTTGNACGGCDNCGPDSDN